MLVDHCFYNSERQTLKAVPELDYVNNQRNSLVLKYIRCSGHVGRLHALISKQNAA